MAEIGIEAESQTHRMWCKTGTVWEQLTRVPNDCQNPTAVFKACLSWAVRNTGEEVWLKCKRWYSRAKTHQDMIKFTKQS